MRRHCSVLGLTALILTGMGGIAEQASACTYGVSLAHATEPQFLGMETVPPQLFDVRVQTVRRGQGPTRQFTDDGRELFVNSSCSGLGGLVLLVAAEDNQTDFSELRYSVELVTGSAPASFAEGALNSFGDDELRFTWPEAPNQGREPLQFELQVTAVDESGNESEPLFIEVTHPGTATESEPIDGWGNIATAPTASDSSPNAPVTAFSSGSDNGSDRPLPSACSLTPGPPPSSGGTGLPATALALLCTVALLRRRHS